MADTVGMMKTRKEWNEAVAAGETELPHAEWYEQKYMPKNKKKNNDNNKLAMMAAED